MLQSQNFETCPHFGDFLDLVKTDTRDPHSTTRLAYNQPLRFQTPERFAHGNMACAKLFSNMILSQSGTRLECPCDDAISKRPADPHRECIIFGGRHFL